ncbi:hypothetical protein [Nitratifractor sp.]|uniref:hypothetical protein n=1 Tax=Nitratifractor sp. TaxID=2268144 RepID=UPI0025E05137|nr:hypothetical protein [Nitratifractor sp.]
MIDRISRDKLAETLRQYVSGRVTNDALDNLEINTKDDGVIAIKDAAWFLYDDLYQHKAIGKHRIEKDNRHEVSKWIIFLQSDEEYLWPRPTTFQKLFSILTLGFYKVNNSNKGEKEAWPFFTMESLENALKKPKLLNGETKKKK